MGHGSITEYALVSLPQYIVIDVAGKELDLLGKG